MSDDDHTPASDNGRQAGGSGFTAFGESDRRAEQTQRRNSLVGKALAGTLVLCAVAVVAIATSGHSAKPKPGPSTDAATVGTVTQPVPPQVVFVSAKQGYAFYSACATQPLGQGCAPTLWRTEDGTAAGWTKLTLPPTVPLDPTHSPAIQVRGDDVLLSWSDAAFISSDDGAHWKPVAADLDGMTSQVPTGDFLIGDTSRLLVVDPVHATALTFRPPQKVEQPGGIGGTLVDGMVWMRDPNAIGVSINNGVNWNITTLPNTEVEAPPLDAGPNFLALLTGPAKGSTTGQPGDGGDLPAANAFFSTNNGITWDSPTVLTGNAQVNALCTVYLSDAPHALLGVSTDGKSLLTLTTNTTAFVPAAAQPAPVPSCLQSHNALLWGATADKVVVKDGSAPWVTIALPAKGGAVVTPTPTPSAK